ncbi:uncharacterized protein LOC141912143 [Tubulanus polymorphus]|uniref:uncharacterized protein LOC141912143 n=1 Tax=Tubulanus polymorphus TaxID=672921 RepID=UPI003DA5E48F
MLLKTVVAREVNMKFVFCFVLCVAALAVSEAFSCDPLLAEDDFCQYDFVMKALVKAVHDVNGIHRYQVKIRKYFKQPTTQMNTFGKKDKMLDIYAYKDTRYAVTLTEGDVYVLGGSYDAKNKRATIGSCQYAKKFNSIAKTEKRKMRNIKCGQN